MKTLLFITLAATLVSCGPKGKLNTAEPVLKNYESALQAQKAGDVTEEVTTGDDYEILRDKDGGFSIQKGKTNELRRTTILKIDGDQIYSLTETNEDGETSRYVELKSISLELKRSEDTLKDMKLKSIGDRMSGVLVLENQDGDSWEYTDENGQIQRASISGGKTTISVSYNKKRMLCDLDSKSTTTGATFVAPNLSQKLDPEVQFVKTSCPRSLTKSELKKIDLQNIGFCDNTKEDAEGNCEFEKDMSFLTSEL